MRNDIKISRELLESYMASAQGYDDSRLRHELLRALIAAPVVERQSDSEALKRAWQAGYDTGFYAKNPAAPVVEAATCAQCKAPTADICNQNGCGYLESGNGAPVVERQEPAALIERARSFVAFVAKCVRKEGEYAPLHRQEMEELDCDLKLYAEQPAPVAVVLPERRKSSLPGGAMTLEDLEWNACLDKVEELNQ